MTIGESSGTLAAYYRNSTTCIQNSIDAQEDEYILSNDTDELTEYFLQDYLLPELQEDTTKEIILKKEKSTNGLYRNVVTFKVGIPLILEEDIEKVISRRADTWIQGLRFSYEQGALILMMQLSAPAANPENSVKNELGQLRKTIQYKNTRVKKGNDQMKREINQYIKQRKQKLEQQNSVLETIAKKLSINLERKENAPVVELKYKKKIKILLPQEKKKGTPYLETSALDAVIELIRNQGRSFELAPEVFSKLDEESLRDIILSMLNAVLEGDATAESFIKKGKTDILLQLKIEGGILSVECKFWGGNKLYQETIDQHFRYLTWQQAHAIQITFSKNEGFTDVIEKAIEATKTHSTYVDNSFREINEQYFVSEHSFPEDPQKKVEFHHLLFNLHFKN